MKVLFAVILGIFLSISAEAAMISFYVIETGIPVNSANKRCSLLWEDTLMDVFFDSGHIVSNAPLLSVASKPAGGIAEAARVRINEATDGGSDYIFIAMLDYLPDAQTPHEILFYAFRISNPQIIYEKRITGGNHGMETKELKAIIREVIPFFNN